jgi:hypothetical protein
MAVAVGARGQRGTTLTVMGVIFIEENGKGFGVWLRKAVDAAE